LLQALIQIAAAMHQIGRGHVRGAATLLRGALDRLERYDARFGELSVAPLRDGVRAWLAVLDGPAAQSRPGPPAVTLVIPDS